MQGADGAAHVAGIGTANVFRTIAGAIAETLLKHHIDIPLPDGRVRKAGGSALGMADLWRQHIGEAAPFAQFREYLGTLLLLLQQRGLGLILMLDEFDKLQEGIDNGVTSTHVPENLRSLIQGYPNFSAILTGQRRLRRLREDHWSALYGLGTNILVSAIDEPSARQVVIEPVRGRLTYASDAVDRVRVLTAHQPFLIQCVCNRIFDFAAKTRMRSITVGIVNRASEDLVKENGHFASLWEDAKTDRRKLLLMLCARMTPSTQTLSFVELAERLIQDGVEADDEMLAADLASLRELELIDFVGEHGAGSYRLTVPLMADWIAQHRDFHVVSRAARQQTEDENA